MTLLNTLREKVLEKPSASTTWKLFIQLCRKCDTVKLRGRPKTSNTKQHWETFDVARVMTSGMVIA